MTIEAAPILSVERSGFSEKRMMRNSLLAYLIYRLNSMSEVPEYQVHVFGVVMVRFLG